MIRIFLCMAGLLAAALADCSAESPTLQSGAPGVIPANFVSLGEGAGYGILVEKSAQRLYIYDSSYNVIRTVVVTTGKRRGNKHRSGDRKTPEGIYFFTDVMDNKGLLPEYGVMALPTNYPNPIDITKRKNGGGIWLHATNQPSRPLKPYDSKGCVVTANEDILNVAEYIELETTPVVTVDKISFTSPAKIMEERAEVSDFLRQWKEDWESGDVERYILNYSENFRAMGKDRKGWMVYKEQLNQRNPNIRVEMKDLKILKHNEYVVAAFIQEYSSDTHSDRGIKRLYLNKNSDEWKIIGEEWREIPAKEPKVIAMAHLQLTSDGKDERYDPEKAVEKVDVQTEDEKVVNTVDIEDFSIDRDKSLKVSFRLVNRAGNGEKIRGRVVTVVEGKNGSGSVYGSYPPVRVRDGEPLNYKDAEWFSINRFKVVKGEIGNPALEDDEIGSVKVWVYSQDGKLLLVRKFPEEGTTL